MKTSLKTRILDYLKSRAPDWVTGGIIEDLAKGYGYKASNASRRCRELENEKSIEVGYYKGLKGENLAKYRYAIPKGEKELLDFMRDTKKVELRIIQLPNGERVARYEKV